jgi:hypothetical protein
VCNLGEGLFEEGFDIGYNIEFNIGYKQGCESIQIRSLRNIMKNANLTFEQAADVLEMPAEERERLADKV